MCMFRVCAEPEPMLLEGVDGMIVKIQADCCVCKQTVTLQQAGAPTTVQKMNRMRVGELAFANVILQPDGQQPFEVMDLRVITADGTMHEKLHKFQALQYEKFVSGPVHLDITNSPSKDVQTLLATPRQTKRLKVSNTNEMPV